MNKTKIEWVKNPDGTPGYTWNPITGCLNGCEYCYARKLANTRLKSRYLANRNLPFAPSMKKGFSGYDNPFYPRFWEERLDDLSPTPRKARGVFVCDMSDLFGIGIPESWTREVLGQIKRRSTIKDRFYLLTKQPQNLIKWSPFPPNVWVGATATSARTLMQGCSDLEDVRAKVKFLSVEPLLDWSYSWTESYLENSLKRANINWIIIGSQTKPYKPPKIEWVEEIVKACDKADIPVFLKENLKPLLQQNTHNIYSFPEWAGTQFAITGDHSLSLIEPHPNEAMRKLRQEMPNE